MDYIMNGQGHGNVASTLLANNFDVKALRPFIGDDGRHYITQNQGGQLVSVPLQNATATLRKDEWKEIDDVCVKAAKPRLRLVGDLRSMGLTKSIGNGFGKTMLQTETQSDITAAEMSMDGINRSNSDRPVYEPTLLPLPIAHKDFGFTARQIATSRNENTPLDTECVALAARRVAETAEQLAIGSLSSYTYGGGTIYGLINYTSRLTKVITSPAASGWTGSTLVDEVLAMIEQARGAYHYGPYVLYTGVGWDRYLDADYSSSKGDNTLRDRVRKIEDIQDVKRLDYLTGYQVVLVQMTPDVIREVIGMEMTTVQWPSEGGLFQNFKVMAILVPQLRVDQNGNGGIVHGNVS